MPNLFGTDIAGEIASALGGELLPATLIKVTAGTRTPGNLGSGTNPTEASYGCRGWVEDYSDAEIARTPVLKGMRRIGLLGATIQGGQIPKTPDKVTIEGGTYEIVLVERDPAAATYLLQVRGA